MGNISNMQNGRIVRDSEIIMVALEYGTAETQSLICFFQTSFSLSFYVPVDSRSDENFHANFKNTFNFQNSWTITQINTVYLNYCY